MSADRVARILACVVVAGCLAERGYAAAPAAGTLSPQQPRLTYTAGPFMPPPLGCVTPPACDDFTLTLQIPGPYLAAHPLATVRVELRWDGAHENYDLYAYEQGAEIGFARGQNPRREYMQLAAVAGTRAIVLKAMPITVAGGSITGTITLDPGPPAGHPPRVDERIAGWSIHAAPATLGNAAHEPTLDVNRNTNRTLFLSGQQTLRVTFDDRTKPARATWEDVSAPLTSLILGDPVLTGDPHPLPGGAPNPRVYAAQLVHFEGQSLFQFTDDDGATWEVGEGGGLPAGVERSSIGVGPYPADFAQPHSYPHAVYYCASGGINAWCSRSDDGGRTFGVGVPIYAADASCGPHGHPQVAADGTVYVPYMNCLAMQGVAVSEDAGQSWTMRPVPQSGGGRGGGMPSLGIGAAGTLYLGYTNSSNDWPRVTVSRDKGRTWSADAVIGAPVGVINALFPAVVAGDDDRAAFAFHGSTTRGNPQHRDFPGVWHLYVATTYDGGRSWSVSIATPDDPVTRKGVVGPDLGTLVALGTTLGDYMDIALDAQGRILVGFSDGCIDGCVLGAPNSFSRKATIARQTDGHGLLARFDGRAGRGPGKTGEAPVVGGGVAWLQLGLLAGLAALQRLRRLSWLLLLPALAHADPPYGDGFDAPTSPDAAVSVATAPNFRFATFAQPADVDSYRFDVAAGAAIRVACTRRLLAVHDYSPPDADAWGPCAVALLDPAGLPRGAPDASNPAIVVLDVPDAAPGEWRVVVAGGREAWLEWVPYCSGVPCPLTEGIARSAASPPEVPYAVMIAASQADLPAPQLPSAEEPSFGGEPASAEPDSSGGGALGLCLLALAAGAGIRRCRRG